MPASDPLASAPGAGLSATESTRGPLRTFDIVVTTIFEPNWLGGYLDNIRTHGHMDAVTIRIICDRKSPPSVYVAAQEAARQGFKIDCPTLAEQETFLRRIGLRDDFIPWNTDNRRNIGFLRAWESGADVLVSIDDDNYCRTDSDYITSHGVVGSPCGADGTSQQVSGAPWFNVCDLLHGDNGSKIYPRGFPYSARTYTGSGGDRAVKIGPLGADSADRVVAVNAGLWLDDPDVDAVSRLALRPTIDRADDSDLILGEGTWSPINTQNTAVHREAIPAYYYLQMGFPVKGMLIDRFGDIWSGYFLQKCAEHLGEAVRVGSPVADHRRTTHNLFKDLYHELAGIILTEDLLPWLREVQLSASNYTDAYAELADAIGEQASKFTGFLWDDGGREFLQQTATHMATWLDVVRTLVPEGERMRVGRPGS
jgi:hypothetical protein